MNRLAVLLSLAAFSGAAAAQDGVQLMDRRSFVHLMVDEFELADFGDENDFVWEADVSAGGDLHKFWAKTEGSRPDVGEDETELQLLYSKALLPFWDLQAGVRRDFESGPGSDRDWAVVAIHGLAPSFFEVEAEVFFGEGGQESLRVKGEYELFLTQRMVLTPELEFEVFSRSEPGRLIGSGLTETEFSMRLRYEVKRELAPYIGLSFSRLHGRTADLSRLAGESRRETQLLLGLRAWF